MPDLLLPRRLPSVAEACDWIEAALQREGWSASDVTRAVLSVGECLSNAVEHGPAAPHARPSPLRVSYELSPDALSVSVADGGTGPSLRQIRAAALPADPLATDGRGLFILNRLTDGVAVGPDGGVRMTFRRRS